MTPWISAYQSSCPSLSLRLCLNSCPFSQWCYLTFSSSATLLFSCPQSFPALGSFPMSWLFTSRGQITETSASASILPVNIQGCFPSGLPKKRKSITVSIFPRSVCHDVMGAHCMILVFVCWVLSQLFYTPFSPSSRDSSFSLLSAIRRYHLYIWGCCYFSWQSWSQLVIHPVWHFPWGTLDRS